MAESTIASSTLIEITEQAAKEIKRLLAEETGNTGIRLAVQMGGCSGKSYTYALGFDNVREADHVVDAHGVKAFIDPQSAAFLNGIVLDFEGGLQGKGFSIKNPNAKGSCGCGKSFSA